MLEPAIERQLLAIARSTIGRAVGVPPADADTDVTADAGKLDRALAELEDAGAFVSLHRRSDGELRGCIGCFQGRGSLRQTIEQMAREAALRDPRFPPLGAAELGDLVVEISVLSPMSDVTDPATIEVGVHGVLVSRGSRRGVLLPQVATDHGWDRERFLDHTCLKAGLPARAWREPDTQIRAFTARVFGELAT